MSVVIREAQIPLSVSSANYSFYLFCSCIYPFILRRKKAPTFSAASTSSVRTLSAGLWLMPPGLRRKSIAVGSRAAITLFQQMTAWGLDAGGAL